MKYLLLLITLPVLMLGQEHENAPIPEISSKPLSSISKGLTGWCLSTDNQWIRGENTIPRRVNSHEHSKFDRRESVIGTDNMTSLRTHLLTYGQDTLILLVKESKYGYYGLKEIKKRWKKQDVSWFYVVSLEDFQKLQNAEMGARRFNIPLLAQGKINQSVKKISDAILPELNLNKDSNYELVFICRKVAALKEEQSDGEKQNYIQFLLFSYHPLSEEVEGIVNPFFVNGRSVMLRKEPLDYCHYQISEESWKAFVKTEF